MQKVVCSESVTANRQWLLVPKVLTSKKTLAKCGCCLRLLATVHRKCTSSDSVGLARLSAQQWIRRCRAFQHKQKFPAENSQTKVDHKFNFQFASSTSKDQWHYKVDIGTQDEEKMKRVFQKHKATKTRIHTWMHFNFVLTWTGLWTWILGSKGCLARLMTVAKKRRTCCFMPGGRCKQTEEKKIRETSTFWTGACA